MKGFQFVYACEKRENDKLHILRVLAFFNSYMRVRSEDWMAPANYSIDFFLLMCMCEKRVRLNLCGYLFFIFSTLV